jgi:hypothetical protein
MGLETVQLDTVPVVDIDIFFLSYCKVGLVVQKSSVSEGVISFARVRGRT